MIVTLECEVIGSVRKRPWVAQIIPGTHGFERSFLRPLADFQHMNSKATRGVFFYFHLPSGFYEIYEHLTWKKDRRRFVKIEKGRITELTKQELLTLVCLSTT